MKYLTIAILLLVVVLATAKGFESKKCKSCRKACKNGFKLDEFGCPAGCICKASDGGVKPGKCPKLSCTRLCATRRLTDENGCKTCKCKPLPKYTNKGSESKNCPKEGKCKIMCRHGRQKNELGCVLCKCNKTKPTDCGKLPKCKLMCRDNRYKKGKDGCPICACLGPQKE